MLNKNMCQLPLSRPLVFWRLLYCAQCNLGEHLRRRRDVLLEIVGWMFYLAKSQTEDGQQQGGETISPLREFEQEGDCYRVSTELAWNMLV